MCPHQLAADSFSKLYRSPLQRASRTAEIVWGERTGPVVDVPSLREVDLYSFQGLMKVGAPVHLPLQPASQPDNVPRLDAARPPAKTHTRTPVLEPVQERVLGAAGGG